MPILGDKLYFMKCKRFYYLIFGLLIVSLLFSACKSKERIQKNITSEDTETKNKSISTFTIRYRPVWTAQTQFAGVYMARKMGFYQDKGLNVIIQPGGPNYSVYDLLQKGESDIVQMSLLTAVKRDAENGNLVNLAQLMQKTSLMLVGKKSRGINSLADFNGKRIGLWKTDERLLASLFLLNHNLKMDIVDLDTSINLFLKDGIDVINVMRYNEYHLMLQAGINPQDLFTVSLDDTQFNLADNGLYTTRAFYEKHPQECRNFAVATINGWLYAFSHQEETINTVLEIMNENHLPANKPHQLWMLKELSNDFLAPKDKIGVLQESDFEKAKKILIEQNMPTTNQTYKSFYPNGN